MAGPMVMQRKAKEGGYLFTLKKDRKVNTFPRAWCDHATGSPYPFSRRIMTNNKTSAAPMRSNIFLRHAASTVFVYNLPKQYPSIITPSQGTNAYTIIT